MAYLEYVDLQDLLLQAQDRCHRIGQTREVHIYRLVSEQTVEEAILAKSDQKRHLDHLAIQSGGFNTEFLQKLGPRDIFGFQGDSQDSGMHRQRCWWDVVTRLALVQPRGSCLML